MVLQPALLCMQFADSAGNIAAGALIQTKALYCIFWIFRLLSEIFLEVDDCFKYQALANSYITLFERVTVLPVLVSALKGSKFLIIICSLQNPKKRKIEDYWHAVVEYLPATWEGALITFRAIAKGKEIRFRAHCIRNCELHAMPIILSICWKNSIYNLKNGGKF